jgi:uncharacterized membrane protein YfcA
VSFSIIIAGLATGLLLGVFGSGGSIITMPALLYLLIVPKVLAVYTAFHGYDKRTA